MAFKSFLMKRVPYLRVGTSYYKLVQAATIAGHFNEILVHWNIETIRQHHGKDYLSKVPKYDGFLHPTVEDGKKLDKEKLREMTEQFVKQMQLKERQAIGFVHRDKAHTHMHLGVPQSTNIGFYLLYGNDIEPFYDFCDAKDGMQITFRTIIIIRLPFAGKIAKSPNAPCADQKVSIYFFNRYFGIEIVCQSS